MAVITNYETLGTAIGDYLARDDLASFAPNFIQNWEERFYRQPLNWANWMESSTSLLTTAATVPADFLGIKYATLTSSPPLQRVSSQMLYATWPRGIPGKPRMIARDGTSFVFGPEPDGEYTLTLRYFAKPRALRDPLLQDGSNWLTTNAPDLCLYGALLEAESFLKNDSRIAVWRDFYTDALADYRDQWKEEEFGGSQMVATLG
jgi:hypothetical protein